MKSAMVERELGNAASERQILEEGIAKFPYFDKLWLMLGQLEERQNKPDAARQVLPLTWLWSTLMHVCTMPCQTDYCWRQSGNGTALSCHDHSCIACKLFLTVTSCERMEGT